MERLPGELELPGKWSPKSRSVEGFECWFKHSTWGDQVATGWFPQLLHGHMQELPAKVWKKSRRLLLAKTCPQHSHVQVQKVNMEKCGISRLAVPLETGSS